MTEVTPHLKSVLKNYQHSATRSLQGPGVCKLEPYDPCAPDEDFVQPPRPAQQIPILSAADTSCSAFTDTLLEGQAIACFGVGGELRLCLPQVLNTALRDLPLDAVYGESEQLMIYFSRCTSEQLNVLKTQGVIPSSTPACGLITKTYAERLCSALLRRKAPALKPPPKTFSFLIYHDCFGTCRGLCYPDLYTGKDAPCIQCSYCSGGFTPQQFVAHVERQAENRTVHWGFDPARWRSYVKLNEEHLDRGKFAECLDRMQERYEGKVPFPKPPPPPPPPETSPVNKRKIHFDDPLKPDPSLDPLLKKKLIEFAPYSIQQFCAMDSLLFHPYLHLLNRQLTAPYKPFPPVFPKDALKVKQEPSYAADIPVLQHPDRVIPLSESEHFERTFQPNVALAPPTPKKFRYAGRPLIAREAKGAARDVKLEPQQQHQVNGHTSVIKGVYNSEMELSTDTDDSASETSEKSEVAKIEDSLKGVGGLVRERIMDAVRNLVKENQSKEARIGELEARVAKLESELRRGVVTCAEKPEPKEVPGGLEPPMVPVGGGEPTEPDPPPDSPHPIAEDAIIHPVNNNNDDELASDLKGEDPGVGAVEGVEIPPSTAAVEGGVEEVSKSVIITTADSVEPRAITPTEPE